MKSVVGWVLLMALSLGYSTLALKDPTPIVSSSDFENENDNQAAADPLDAEACDVWHSLGVVKGTSKSLVHNPYNIHIYIEDALGHATRKLSPYAPPQDYRLDAGQNCSAVNYGWWYTAEAACHVLKTINNLTTFQLNLAVQANKTSCFNKFDSVPKTVYVSGSHTVKATRPALRSAVLGKPTIAQYRASRSFCTARGLLTAGFPSRIATGRGVFDVFNLQHHTDPKIQRINETMVRVFRMWYTRNNMSTKCATHIPSLQIPKKWPVAFRPLAACYRAVDVSRGNGISIDGQTFAVYFQASMSCRNGSRIDVVLAGDHSVYAPEPVYRRHDFNWTGVKQPRRANPAPPPPKKLPNSIHSLPPRPARLPGTPTNSSRKVGRRQLLYTSCPSGYYLGNKGVCYLNCMTGYSGNATGWCHYPCPPGYPSIGNGMCMNSLGLIFMVPQPYETTSLPYPPPPHPPPKPPSPPKPPQPPPPLPPPSYLTFNDASCSSSFSCLLSSSTFSGASSTFPTQSSGQSYFAMPLKSSLNDIIATFNPLSFLQAAQSVGNKATCALAVQGSSLSNAVLPTGPLAFISNAVTSAADLMASLPVQSNQYYFVGMFATGIPGIDTGSLPAMQIASAINPCIGDYFFVFNGVQIDVPVEFAAITVGLNGMGFSESGALLSDPSVANTLPQYSSAASVGIPANFWTPWGMTTLGINGQIWTSASASLQFPKEVTGSVSVEFDATGTLLINYDPLNNGATNGDNQIMLSVTGSPTINLPFGQQISLASFASATTTLYWSFISTSDYALALNMNAQVGLGNFLQTSFPWLPSAVVTAVNAAYPGQSEELDVYVSNQAWGVRYNMNLAGQMSPLVAIYDFLALIEGWPNTLDLTFSLSGSMTGNGLPVVVDLSANGQIISMIFCSSNSDCPSGYPCQLGMCYTTGCPSAHPYLYGALCYDNCPSGWSMLVAGTCYAPCQSGYTDDGLDCIGCPSGYYSDGALMCYQDCGSGYTGVAGVCWQNCPSGWTDTGAFCTLPDSTYGKGCCCDTCAPCCNCCEYECDVDLTCSTCCGNCPSGYTDTGCTCEQYSQTIAKNTYTTSGISAVVPKATDGPLTPYALVTLMPSNSYW